MVGIIYLRIFKQILNLSRLETISSYLLSLAHAMLADGK